MHALYQGRLFRSRRKSVESWPRQIPGRSFLRSRTAAGSKDSMQKSPPYESSRSQTAFVSARWLPRAVLSSMMSGVLLSNRASTSSNRGTGLSVPSSRYCASSSRVRSSISTSAPAVLFRFESCMTARVPSFNRCTSSSAPQPRSMARRKAGSEFSGISGFRWKPRWA